MKTEATRYAYADDATRWKGAAALVTVAALVLLAVFITLGIPAPVTF